MKKLLSILAGILISSAIWAQGFNYQAVARDASGAILSNQTMDVEISIYNSASSNTPLYTENHDVTTNAYGLFTLVIGKGVAISGNFDNTDWGATGHFLGVKIGTGNTTTDLGRTALQGVPYSKFANVAEKVTDAKLSELTDVQTTTLADGQVLKWNAGSQSWQPANDNVASGSGASVNTAARLTGDGSSGNPLDLARQSAQDGQVMTWQGSSWRPVTPPGTTYQAGTGIAIQNNTIVNTGDTNPNDDITTSTTAGGDISGTFSNLQLRTGVVGSNEIANGSIQAVDLANGVIPTTLPPGGAAGGDLSGNYPNPLVSRLQGRTVSSTAPANGQVLRWSGTQWTPANENVQTYVAGTGIAIQGNMIINTGDTNPGDDLINGTVAGGDLGGIYPSPIVDGIQGRPINNAAPTSGQVLTWNGSTWGPATPTGGNSVWNTSNTNAFYNTGNVGIGLNTPQNKLHLHNSDVFAGSPSNLQLTNNSTGTAASDGLLLTLNSTVADFGLIGGLLMRENASLGFGTNNAYHLFLKQNGLLGLGTFNPQGKMDILHNSTPTSPQLMISEDEAGFGRINFRSIGVNNKYWTIAARSQANDPASQFNFYYFNGTSGQDILSVNGNGNVGIGTVTPSRLLQVHLNNNSTNTGNLYLTQAGSGDALMHLGIVSGGHYSIGVDNSDSDKLKIGYNNFTPNGVDVNTRLTIDQTGNIGIGTTTPSERLDVTGNINVNGKINRPSTGATNLVPICYGTVVNGLKTHGPSNFTVTKNNNFTGVYNVDIQGENYSFDKYTVIVTLRNPGQSSLATASSADGRGIIVVSAFNNLGGRIENDFNFVVYKN